MDAGWAYVLANEMGPSVPMLNAASNVSGLAGSNSSGANVLQWTSFQ
jgi:hypothetical protein